MSAAWGRNRLKTGRKRAMPITPRFLRCTHRQCFRVFFAAPASVLSSFHSLFGFVLQSMFPNKRGELLPTGSPIPRLTPHPVTVGAFAFTRHSPPMCSILHRDCCGEKAKRWRFRSGSDGSGRPLNSRRTAVLCRGNKKSEFTRGGFNSDRVVVDHVGKQGEKAPGARFLRRA